MVTIYETEEDVSRVTLTQKAGQGHSDRLCLLTTGLSSGVVGSLFLTLAELKRSHSRNTLNPPGRKIHKFNQWLRAVEQVFFKGAGWLGLFVSAVALTGSYVRGREERTAKSPCAIVRVRG